jgi:hypothetical protein
MSNNKEYLVADSRAYDEFGLDKQPDSDIEEEPMI